MNVAFSPIKSPPSPSNSDLQVQLLCAVREGDEKLVRSLLEKKAEVDFITSAPCSTILLPQPRTTALIDAAELGHRKIVDLLIAAKADVNYPPSALKLSPPIFTSSVTGREADCCMISLLKNGANLFFDASSFAFKGNSSPLLSMASKCNVLGLKVAFAYSLAGEMSAREALKAHFRVCLLPFIHGDLIPIILGYHDTTELDLAQNAIKLANLSINVTGWRTPQRPLSVCVTTCYVEDKKNEAVRLLLNMGADPENYSIAASNHLLAFVESTKQIVRAAIVKKKKRLERDLAVKARYHSDYELPFTAQEASVIRHLREIQRELSALPAKD